MKPSRPTAELPTRSASAAALLDVVEPALPAPVGEEPPEVGEPAPPVLLPEPESEPEPEPDEPELPVGPARLPEEV